MVWNIRKWNKYIIWRLQSCFQPFENGTERSVDKWWLKIPTIWHMNNSRPFEIQTCCVGIRAPTVMTKQFISELKQMDQKTIKNYMFKCANWKPRLWNNLEKTSLSKATRVKLFFWKVGAIEIIESLKLFKTNFKIRDEERALFNERVS